MSASRAASRARSPLFIQVAYGADWWEPFISGVSGLICTEELMTIEEDIKNGEEDRQFTKGRGDYLFEALWSEGFSDDGRYIPGYHELDLVAFRKLQTGEPEEAKPEKMLAPPPVEVEAPYPFLRDQYEMPPPECDGDGDGEDPWPDSEIVACWRPGATGEPDGDPPVWTTFSADGTGAILLTKFAGFRNAQGKEMVTYKRRWRDPDGRVFGKNDYRTCSREKFDRLAKGYAFDFEVRSEQ